MATAAEQLAELKRLRDAGEVSPHDFDLNFVFMANEAGTPIRRQDLSHGTGLQAIVLSKADMDQLGTLSFIHSSGEEMTIETERMTEAHLVILPSEVGE